MTKEEFKEMFLECFDLEIVVDYDSFLNIRLKDSQTREILIETYVSCGEVVRSGSSK